jgi:hypothetical protein
MLVNDRWRGIELKSSEASADENSKKKKKKTKKKKEYVSASTCSSDIYIYGRKGLTKWRARFGETSDITAGHIIHGSLGLYATRATPI